MEKKKIFFIAAVLVAMTVLSSCGKKNSIAGKWKFDDGSTIRFNTKNGTYVAKGDSNSTEGDFELMKCGTLTTIGTNEVPEDYRISLTDSGFDIDFRGAYISFKGKKVTEIGDLNGKYSGKLGENNIIFSFTKKTSTLEVGIDTGDGIKSEKFSYSIAAEDRIYFTSGMYATGDSYLIEYIGPKQISIDGSLLTK
jgi:hypothetical protein